MTEPHHPEVCQANLSSGEKTILNPQMKSPSNNFEKIFELKRRITRKKIMHAISYQKANRIPRPAKTHKTEKRKKR